MSGVISCTKIIQDVTHHKHNILVAHLESHMVTCLSMITHGIRAILGHSFPPLLWQLAFNNGQLRIVNTEREEGSPFLAMTPSCHKMKS